MAADRIIPIDNLIVEEGEVKIPTEEGEVRIILHDGEVVSSDQILAGDARKCQNCGRWSVKDHIHKAWWTGVTVCEQEGCGYWDEEMKSWKSKPIKRGFWG